MCRLGGPRAGGAAWLQSVRRPCLVREEGYMARCQRHSMQCRVLNAVCAICPVCVCVCVSAVLYALRDVCPLCCMRYNGCQPSDGSSAAVILWWRVKNELYRIA